MRRTSRRIRHNPPVKLTAKQLGAYKAMLRGGASVNDGYNKQAYGMTYEQFRAIGKIEDSLSGMRDGRMTLADANKLLDGHKVGGTRLTDAEIDAVAKAFGKVRANSRRRASVRKNSRRRASVRKNSRRRASVRKNSRRR